MEPTAAVLALELPEMLAKKHRREHRDDGKPAAKPSHDLHRPPGDAAGVHELPGEDEQRHRHQRPGVERRERPLGNDFEGDPAFGEERRHAAQTDREGDRDPEREQQGEGDDERGDHRASSPCRSDRIRLAAAIVMSRPLSGSGR